MIQESIIRPVVNSLMWAQKESDPERTQEILKQCVQYLEHLNCGETDLCRLLRSGEMPSFSFLYQALQKDELIEVIPSLQFIVEEKEEQIEVIEEPILIEESEKSIEDSTQEKDSIPEVVKAEQSEELKEKNPSPTPKKELSQVDKEIRALKKKIHSYSVPQKKSVVVKEISKKKNVNFWGNDLGKKELSSCSFISEESCAVFSQHNLHCVSDLLLFAPKNVQGYAQTTLSTTMPDGQYVIRGRIISKFIRFSPHVDRWELVLEQNNVQAHVLWNETPRGWDSWSVGDGIGFVGEVEIEDDIRVFGAEPLGLKGKGSGLMAEYGLIDELEHRNIIADLLTQYEGHIQDPLPNDIVDSAKLLSFGDALREAHFPANREFRGRKRLAFDEVFSYLLCNRLLEKKESHRGYGHRLLHQGIAHLGQVQNINLNDEQEIIFSRLRRELSASQPMCHILQGDVGSGKTLLAFFCAILVAKAGKVVLYISASEHDAERRYLSAETLFSEIGVKAQLVPSDLSKAQNDALERNELQVVFGTDRLLNPENQHKVGLVIIEDTEEEGIVQKMARVTPKKKVMPDILLFTPSPLPLSSLEKFFSGMSLSVLKTPKISHPSTVISTAEERKDVYAAVDAQLKEGRQAYIVLPRQKEKDLLSLADALSMAGKVREAFLPEARIGVYSTEMSRLERMRVFEDFQHKRIDVLFCTAHIEDVPAVRNVACVVLEFADKNSFMRVHRLRGLLYGSYYDACCYLIPSPQTSAEKLDKLRQIAHQTDGFALAEQAPSLPIPYRWLKGESSLRLKARSLIQKINSGDVQRGRWPLLIHHIEGLWPKETENLEFTSTRKLKKRRGRKNRR